MVYHNNGLNIFPSFCIQELHLHMNEEYQYHQLRGWIWYACHILYFWPFKNIKDKNDIFLNWCKKRPSFSFIMFYSRFTNTIAINRSIRICCNCLHLKDAFHGLIFYASKNDIQIGVISKPNNNNRFWWRCQAVSLNQFWINKHLSGVCLNSSLVSFFIRFFCKLESITSLALIR